MHVYVYLRGCIMMYSVIKFVFVFISYVSSRGKGRIHNYRKLIERGCKQEGVNPRLSVKPKGFEV